MIPFQFLRSTCQRHTKHVIQTSEGPPWQSDFKMFYMFMSAYCFEISKLGSEALKHSRATV